ncbi:MAG TPA: hypothetical protein VGR64_04555, partial [Terracidiphilus sp.]|nr:hypothetical protein [Terracidiphilus sp.]
PTVYVENFCAREAAEPPVDAYRGDFNEESSTLAPLKAVLFEDARTYHFRDLIVAWDNLMALMDHYHAECISYVESLKSEIAAASSLPSYNLARSAPPWVQAAPLAIIVFYRQLGLDTGHLSRASANAGMDAIAYQASSWFAQGAPDEITKINSKLDKLIAQREIVEKLMSIS